MIHKETHNDAAPRFSDSSTSQPLSQVASNAALKLKSSALLMTCLILIAAPNGSLMEVRALLDSASSASFVSECLTQSLGLLMCIRVFVCWKALSRHLRLPFNPLQGFRFHPHSYQHIIVEGVLSSLLSLYQRLPVSCQFILSHLTCLGNILLTYLWLIRAMVNLVELTYYSELMFSLMFSFRAGGQVLLTHLWHWRQNLAEFSVAAQITVLEIRETSKQ